jgi:signal transduction histidine kinase/ActR/RegA family two-component response regulator
MLGCHLNLTCTSTGYLPGRPSGRHREERGELRLRTKFLLSLVLITAGLTCATLLVVRQNAQERVQREIQEDALNALLTFQVVQHQHQVALSRKADLLASLAFMRNGDATTIQDISEDPWQSDDCDLFVLADGSGKIVALHTTTLEFPVATAEDLLRRSRKEGSTSGWWYSGKRLYQVVLQPFYDGVPTKSTLLGTVIVGRGIDPAASDLRPISSSDLAFRYGRDIVASTLSSAQEQELVHQLRAKTSQEQIQIDGERFFASSVELTSGSHPALSLTVLKSYAEALASLQKLNHLLGGLGLVAVLAGGVLIFVISDKFTHPLACLVEGVRALGQGNFTYPLEANGRDEVAQVTRAFDRMRSTLKRNESQRQQLEDQLRQAQKMEAMGRLAGGIAHDFNNLLTVIKGHSDLLVDRLQPTDPVHRSACQIDKAANRATSLTRQLLAFCRMQVLQPKVLDLNALVTEMSSLLRRLIREDIAFTFQPGESLRQVKADPGQIEQVIMNLTVNAGDAMPEGGRLTIETRNVTVDDEFAQTRPPMLPGQYVRMAVVDTGQGMDANTKARIFEPFFTTKERGKGTGLGLATVYGVVKQSGGCIWVESEPGKGARFEVYLPTVDELEERPNPKAIAAEPTHRSETVLIVEDEDEVRELAAEFMQSAGYTVLTAKDGQEALAIVERSGERIHVLVTDVVMPNIRGPELAKRLKSIRADIRIVYMSGYLEYNRSSGEFLEDSLFLQKPFTRDTLVRKMSEALTPDRIAVNPTL